MKKIVLFVVIFISFFLSSCTPLVISGAAIGGAYVGYKAAEEGYSINITKPIKGAKNDSKNDNNTMRLE